MLKFSSHRLRMDVFLEFGRRETCKLFEYSVKRGAASKAYLLIKFIDIEIFVPVLRNEPDRLFDAVTVYILKEVAKCPAKALLIFHNHPSGNNNPSRGDDDMTTKIKEAMKLFDIAVFDHIIIAGSGYYSYADNGKI